MIVEVLHFFPIFFFCRPSVGDQETERQGRDLRGVFPSELGDAGSDEQEAVHLPGHLSRLRHPRGRGVALGTHPAGEAAQGSRQQLQGRHSRVSSRTDRAFHLFSHTIK